MSPDESPFRVLSLIDEEPVLSAGGTLQWVPLRRRLGIRAFGTNAFRAARAGDPVVEDHVESPGQEELYVVVSGRALLSVDDHEIDAPAGTARPIIRFRLACCHAQAGAGEVALEELRRAIELDPSMRERAATEKQLAPLRDLEGWRALVG